MVGFWSYTESFPVPLVAVRGASELWFVRQTDRFQVHWGREGS